MKRLDQLDGFRVFAIAVIILSHMEFIFTSGNYNYGEFYKTYLHNPTMGVDYFFMLSGFGIFYSSIDKDSYSLSLKNSLRFAIKKIKKIYPVYILSMIICLPIGINGLLQNGYSIQRVLLMYAFRAVFGVALCQSAFGHTGFSHMFNGVCWFLSTLTIIYLICPIFVSYCRKHLDSVKKCVKAIVATIVILVFISFVFLMIQNIPVVKENGFNDFFYGSPYVRCFYVLLGMETAQLYLLISKISNRLNFCKLEYIVTVVSLIYFFTRNLIANHSPINLCILRTIDVTLCLLFLFIIAFGDGKFSKGLIVLAPLGKQTMYIFLIHYPVRLYVDFIIRKFQVYFGQLTGIFEMLIIIFLSILASYILFKISRVRSKRRC